MGVLGFAPFLQKQFPEVIRELPQRLRSLAGKTIAIDGTLITQRLHFAPVPCENRHILGWYRLMRELKECGVGVICVFDGEERSHAKQRETERRRKLQRVDVARGAMEMERSRRLRRLTTLLKQYQGLPGPVKDRATETLQGIVLMPPEQWEIHEPVPLRETAFNPDVDMPPFTGKQLEPQFPSTSRIESYACTKLPSEEGIPSRLDETPKVQTSESGLWTLKDLLPEYFVSASAATTSKRQDVFDPHLKERLDNDVSPREGGQIHTTDLPRGALLGKTRSPEFPPWLAQSHTVSFRGDADVFNDASSFVEDARSSPDKTLASQQDPLLENKEWRPDDNLLNSSDTFVESIPSSPDSWEDIPSPSTFRFNESLEPDGDSDLATQKNGSAMSSDLNLSPPDIEIVEAEPSPEEISQGLFSLYREYQESIPTFMSPPILDPPAEATIVSEEVSVQEQYLMSRNQAQLTLDEGSLWEALIRPSSPASVNMESTLTEEKLESLAQKSDIISRSYEKRNNPPTAKTYEECKLILRAMGVPCIEAVGPYEAEALAASLVHNGLADYVASEDTDVLVYEAPLLRNLTNRQTPLVLLSGAEVREVLRLDRASYVDFALLLGTDFSQRIKHLGPARAIKLIRTHGRIEHVIANEPKFIPRVPHDVYMKQVELARLVFETLPPIPDPATLQPTESDDAAVVAILEKFGVYRAASVDWDFGSALDGNYFGDDPAIA